MVASLSTPTQIVNDSLVRIGWKQRIGSLYDGSEAAQLSLAIYGQVRDELLRKMEPGFSMRNGTLTLLKQAPAGGYIPGVSPWNPVQNPPTGWLFEYAYPGDCLKVRAVKPTPFFFPNVDPQDYVFSIDNDTVPIPPSSTPPGRVILCNVVNALVVYTGRVTDPTSMDVGFVEVLTETLGERLAPALVGLDPAKFEAVEGQGEMAMAEMEQG